MSNFKRYFEKNIAYFVTSVTNNRKHIFTSEKNIIFLLLNIEYFKTILDYKIFAFCILSDHFHFIIQPLGQYNLSYMMKMIKGTFSRKLNKISNSTGHIWQKRFYDEGLRNESMLINKIEYIHNNPIKHNLATDLDKFKYSSYQYYFNNKTHVLNVDVF